MENESSQTVRSPARIQSRPSPFLLLIYPIILGLGSIFATISPIAGAQHTMPLAAGVTSDMNTPTVPAATNYFAGKRNIINTLFVKRGWFWTSLAFLLLQISTRPSSTSNRRPNHYVQAALRYALVTMSWIITTQWCFGPPLIDKSYTLTGGHCEGLPAKMQESAMTKVATLYSSTACKASGGTWRGGHDISGHVFMLALSSAFLLYELFLADRHSWHPTVSPRAAANAAHEMTAEEKEAVGGWESEQFARFRIYVRYFLYGVVGLDLWMMMMTAIWFHTWLEKLNGMLIAGLTLYLTYFLGDYVPEWRSIFGGL